LVNIKEFADLEDDQQYYRVVEMIKCSWSIFLVYHHIITIWKVLL
jgi:hypothetical protein